MIERVVPFSFRGAEGAVTVSYRANDDPERWGYAVLGLPWPSSLARGLPVIEARVAAPLEGYAAVMAWIQVVRIQVLESSKPLVAGVDKAPSGDHAWVDGPPQLRGLGVPFVSFGHLPTLFDAPASTESDIRFIADSFLTATPDALMSRHSCPIVGLRWGYATRGADERELVDIALLAEADWAKALPVLEEAFPDWRFGSDWLS